MGMFCYQCQETVGNKGCTIKGVCGKSADTSNLMDLLIYTLKGIGTLSGSLSDETEKKEVGDFTAKALFATITNGNFDDVKIKKLIYNALEIRNKLKSKDKHGNRHDAVTWELPESLWLEKAMTVGTLSIENEDIRSLKHIVLFGIKGIAAYYDHANKLGYSDNKITEFILSGLAATLQDLDVKTLIDLVLKTGETAVTTMALLDKANSQTYGKPGITTVKTGVRKNPGILISGHDLKDLEDLLKQTEGTGVDVYTHGEMLPAHYYPAFKKYSNFAGNYGSSWWLQDKEFDSFNGPILLTTNCITPVKDSYKERFYTTGIAGYPGTKHISEPNAGKEKDFSSIISQAKKCAPPTEIENGEIIGGFAHDQVMALADKVVAAVKSGAVKRFVVMAGCDGRQKARGYFTETAQALPEDTIILTAGCAKYRYNKLGLGDIGGIPRVLDAGQCNDSYSLAVIALKLKEVFGLSDINQLPISFDIAWYEQKAVTVLLALLFLGVKGIRLGPTLPAFISPGVTKVLVDNFDIKAISTVESDVKMMMAGK